MTITAADALNLSITVRIQLVSEIWDSIAECPEQVDVPPEVLELVRRRLEDHRLDPRAGSPWSEVRERILGSE